MAARTVVFVEPPYVCWDRRMDRVREGEEEMPGVGTLVLTAVARERGHRAHIVDGKRSGTPIEDVAQAIAAHDPDHVGVSAMTISVTNAAEIAERVEAAPTPYDHHGRRAARERHPRANARDVFGFDYGVVGEGERSYFDLIDALDAGRDPRDVAGLVYRDGSVVRANPRAPYLDGAELDELPQPAWDLAHDFPLRFQPNVFNYRATPVASLVTSRGCPFSCTFCDRSTSGRRGRFHSVDYVMRMCHGSPISACGTCSSTTTFSRQQAARDRALRALPRSGLHVHVELQQPSEPARSEHARAHEARRLLADRVRDRVGFAASPERRQARGEDPAHAGDAPSDPRGRHPREGSL
jgi:hypothetical protein